MTFNPPKTEEVPHFKRDDEKKKIKRGRNSNMDSRKSKDADFNG
jgi:23S rRNA maturation mini-RNase III